MLLLIDTVGLPARPGVAVALWAGGDVTDLRHAEAGRGALERLFPLIDALLTDAVRADITGVGAATGPGGFAAMRAGVAAVRGLALGMGAPALGASWLEAIGFGRAGACVACLAAPGGVIGAQEFQDGAPQGPARRVDAPPMDALGEAALGAQPLAALGACLAARLAAEDAPRPGPLYLRPPDAVKAPPPPQAL